MDKVEADKTAAVSVPAPELKPVATSQSPAQARIEQLEAENKRLQSELNELAAWQAQAVGKAESIYTKHQQLLKELRTCKAALNESEVKLGAHRREVDILKMDFKNLQQALGRAEQEARKGRETVAELEQCKKQLLENTPKTTA